MNAREKLLHRLKAHVSTNPEARQSFRNDVPKFLEWWDGQSPVMFFSWDSATLPIFVGHPDARPAKRLDTLQQLVSALRMGAEECFIIDDEASKPIAVSTEHLLEATREYYGIQSIRMWIGGTRAKA